MDTNLYEMFILIDKKIIRIKPKYQNKKLWWKRLTLEPCFNDFPYLLEYPLLIDVNNVAYYYYHIYEKPHLGDVLTLIDYLIRKIGFPKNNIHCICDPSLKYYIDKPNEFNALVREELILEAPKVADEMILGFALKYEFCFIISNDRFRDYIKQLPSRQWLEDRRIPFMFIGEDVCLSPNINNSRIDLLPLNEDKMGINDKKTTMGVLDQIEKAKGVLDLF